MMYCMNNPAHIKRLVSLGQKSPNILPRLLTANLQAATPDYSQAYAIIKALSMLHSACSMALFFNQNSQLKKLYHNFLRMDEAYKPEPKFKPHNTMTCPTSDSRRSKFDVSEDVAIMSQVVTKSYSTPHGSTFCGSPPSDATHKQRSEYARQHGSTHIGTRFVPKSDAPKKRYAQN